MFGQALIDKRAAHSVYAYGIILRYLGFLLRSEFVFQSCPKTLEPPFFVAPFEIVVGQSVVKGRESRRPIDISERIPMRDDIGQNAFEAVVAIDEQKTVADAGQRLPRISDKHANAIFV